MCYRTLPDLPGVVAYDEATIAIEGSGMAYKLGMVHEFTAGADIGMMQYVRAEWSVDETELLIFPTSQ